MDLGLQIREVAQATGIDEKSIIHWDYRELLRCMGYNDYNDYSDIVVITRKMPKLTLMAITIFHSDERTLAAPRLTKVQ